MEEYELKLRASALKKAEEVERVMAELPALFRFSIEASRNDCHFGTKQSRALLSLIVGAFHDVGMPDEDIGLAFEEIKEQVIRPGVFAMLEALATRYRALVSGPLPKKRSGL